MVRRSLTLLGSVLLAGCGRPGIPPHFLEILTGDGTFELLSLDPHRQEPAAEDSYHGFQILGRTTIDDAATKARLIDALKVGASERNLPPATGFEPRHAIRITRPDLTTDFLLGFSTSQVQIYENDQEKNGFLVSPAPRAAFDDMLRAKGIAPSAP